MAVRAEAVAKSGVWAVRHYIPYARSDMGSSQVEAVVKWLGVNELLAVLRTLPPEKEFPLLLDFLVEFGGSLELARHRLDEMLVDQAAVSYKAHAEAVKNLKNRLMELFEGTVDEA